MIIYISMSKLQGNKNYSYSWGVTKGSYRTSKACDMSENT